MHTQLSPHWKCYLQNKNITKFALLCQPASFIKGLKLQKVANTIISFCMGQPMGRLWEKARNSQRWKQKLTAWDPSFMQIVLWSLFIITIYWELTLTNWLEAFFQQVWPTKGTTREWIPNSPASSAEKRVLGPAGSNALRDSLFSSILGSPLGDTKSKATTEFSPNLQKICSGLKLEMDLGLLLHCANVSPTVKT